MIIGQQHKMNLIRLSEAKMEGILQALEDQKQSQPKQQINCRICLQQMPIDQTFSCCHCKGANRYVHQKCLLEWIKRLKKYKQGFNTSFCLCDICKGKIFLQNKLSIRIIEWNRARQQFLENFCQKELCCTASAVIIFIMSAFIVGIIVHYGNEEEQVRVIDQKAYIIGLAISVFVLVLDIVVYALHFVIQIQNTAYGIKNIFREKNQQIELKLQKDSKNIALQESHDQISRRFLYSNKIQPLHHIQKQNSLIQIPHLSKRTQAKLPPQPIEMPHQHSRQPQQMNYDQYFQDTEQIN